MVVSKPHQLIVVGSDSGWLRLIDVVDTIVEVAEANNCQRFAILPLSTATQHSGIIIASFDHRVSGAETTAMDATQIVVMVVCCHPQLRLGLPRPDTGTRQNLVTTHLYP
ncbi:hypothetical protein Tco_0754162 [Tanacetum coccineum]